MSTQFKVNDIVEAFGCRGVVAEICEDECLRVDFTESLGHIFYLDGRQCMWHREPSLKLISRPKRMVTKTIEYWANVYPRGLNLYSSKEVADIHRPLDRIACVRLVGTYEVEEDV